MELYLHSHIRLTVWFLVKRMYDYTLYLRVILKDEPSYTTGAILIRLKEQAEPRIVTYQ